MVSSDPLYVEIGAYILKEYVPAKALVSNLEVEFIDSEQTDSPCGPLNCGDSLKFSFARADCLPTAVNIIDSQVLVEADSATSTKRVVQLTLDTDNSSYEPGDTLAILPSNSYDYVAKLLQRLDLISQADDRCLVKLALNCAKKGAKVPAHIPPSTSPREIFTHCLSLNGVPQKQFLSALAACTSDAEERSFLGSLSSKQGSAFYQELILERGLNTVDLLQLCGSCQPTLALLVEHLPRLLPRPYSIANSRINTRGVSIIYSIREPKAGVTTLMVETKRHQPKPQIYIYPRLVNAFRYTAQDQILIAVGTGLAPFLGFLAHKQQLCNQHSTWLYVGAKTPQALLKREQLLSWKESSVLQRLRLCYSRSDEASPKYVQQLLEEDAENLIDFLLKPETVLYICADGAKISQSIGQGLSQCLQRVLQLDESQAGEKLKELRTQGKYREDIWL